MACVIKSSLLLINHLRGDKKNVDHEPIADINKGGIKER